MRHIGVSSSLIIAIALLLFTPGIIDVVNGKLKGQSGCDVMLVLDGDTVEINCSEHGLARGRIMGYDSPEMNARCVAEFILAMRATWALRVMLWQAHTIEIKQNGKDKYNRDLITLQINGKNVQTHMISKGLARAYNGGKRGSWCL